MRRKKKIFRPKRRYKIKRNNGYAIKIAAGVAAVAILIFVGYSAAGPISRFIEERREVQSDSQVWTPGEETEQSAQESVSPDMNDEGSTSEPVQTDIKPAETEAVQSTVSQTEPQETVNISSGGAAYPISAEDMADMETLEAALDDAAASGCSAVIFPVKTKGGIFRYATDIELVHTVYEGTDPIASEITAKQLAEAAEKRGLRAAALVSVLYDNNRYGDYRDGSYRTYDDDAWLDTSPDKGGKPWLSPFDDVTKDYMCDIVTELAEAGFEEIICDDFIFPEFRSSDIELIGDYVEPYGDRYLALTELAQLMTKAGENAGAQVMLRITANSVIKGYSELFHPDELEGCSIIIDYSEDNIGRTMVVNDDEVILDDMEMYEKISAVYGAVASRCENMSTAVMLDRESMSADEFDEAVKAVTALGYDRYYIY